MNATVKTPTPKYHIEQVALFAPEDILMAAQNYVNPNFDMVLVRVITEGLEDNPCMIMLGIDKKQLYIVVEDDDMAEYHYPETNDGDGLIKLYNKLVEKIVIHDMEWLQERGD